MTGEVPGINVATGLFFERDDSNYVEGSAGADEVHLVDWSLPAYTNFDITDRTIYFKFVVRFRMTDGGMYFVAYNDSDNPSPFSADLNVNTDWIEQTFSIMPAYNFGDGHPGGGSMNEALVNAVRTGTWGYQDGPLVWAGFSNTAGTVQIDYLGLLVEGDSAGPYVPPVVGPTPIVITPDLSGLLGPVDQFYA